MRDSRFIDHALGLAAAAEDVPVDVEDRIAAMDLEPTLRDRALLLVEQTRMLAERAAEGADTSDRLRGASRLAEEIADARADTLDRREATADARDDMLAKREDLADARERHQDQRERSSELHEERMVRRARALDEPAADGLAPLVAAIDRGWRAARRTTGAQTDAAEFETAAFDAVIAELEQTVPAMVERAMHRWVSHANHELRQPLAVIAGVAETLGVHHEQLDEQTVSTLVARLRRQCMFLQRVIDQLDAASRLRSGALEVAPLEVDVRPLIDQVVGDYEQLLNGATVSFVRPADPVIACVDPSAVTEILLVLLRNAVDHAPCDEPILIATDQHTTTVRVSVHDDGPGVPPAGRESIFDYGTRMDDAGTLGLGLFIARRLARAHGGDLTVGDSQRLGGARFDLTLPTDCAPDADGPR